MKISVIASNQGDKALYLYEFFKEGNRITVDSFLTDNPESPAARAFRNEGIDVIVLSESVSSDLGHMLKERGVEFLVVDDFEGLLPGDLINVFSPAVVYPSTKESAPLEVIEASDKLKAQAVAVAPSQPMPQTAVSPKRENDTKSTVSPSVEQEWAEVLDIKTDNPENPDSTVDGNPPTPKNSTPQPPEFPNEPGNQEPPRYPFGTQQPPHYPYAHRRPEESMPPTYLIWSVLITIFCCFIPGVIAIIYAASVSSKYYQRDIEAAKRASRNAQIWCIVSIVAAIIWATLYLPLALFLS